jgi:hypothetical protein
MAKAADLKAGCQSREREKMMVMTKKKKSEKKPIERLNRAAGERECRMN